SAEGVCRANVVETVICFSDFVNFLSMAYQLLAGLTVLIHLAFVVFVVAGGVLVIRWRRLMWIHIAAVIWAAAVELFGWICPLTPLENWFRQRSGQGDYHRDFVAHFILPLLYPDGLTREVQIVLGLSVIIINLSVYLSLSGGTLRSKIF
ncbi:MAG: DUF2784 domain-containing protein, partial [Candidatus Binatia bacterium]